MTTYKLEDMLGKEYLKRGKFGRNFRKHYFIKH